MLQIWPRDPRGIRRDPVLSTSLPYLNESEIDHRGHKSCHGIRAGSGGIQLCLHRCHLSSCAKATIGAANIANGSARDPAGSTSVYIVPTLRSGQHPLQGSSLTRPGIRRDQPLPPSLPCFTMKRIRPRGRQISAGSCRAPAGSALASSIRLPCPCSQTRP